ncbi:MAG: molybdopterin biosynthesis protein [Candidatus Binatia bacterium]|nr:molybdopterin biosynthesis protein [Candidatus Binatia bacterium]
MGRKRYLNKQPLETARSALLAATRRLTTSEVVPVDNALGRITAEAIFAKSSVPHYHGAAMDGIALRAEDTFGASEGRPITFEHGTPESAERPFTYVDTGNALPPWANAVVMIERVFSGDAPEGSAAPMGSAPAVSADDGCCDTETPEEHAGHSHGDAAFASEPVDGTSAQTIHLRGASGPWQHVRLVGEDVVASEPLLPRGHRVRPYDIGALLAAGVHEAAVRPRPVVAILPTGDELIQPGDELQAGRVIEFNSRMIAAFVREWGGEPLRLDPVRDDLDEIRARIGAGLAEADVLCIIAGSSAGQHDFTVEALSGFGEILAHGIDVMPGKPASIMAAKDSPRASVAIGVPGYPVSAAVICRELLEPLLSHLVGTGVPDRPTVRAIVPRKLPSRLGQEEFVRVTVGKVADRLIVSPLARGAGAITTMVKADGFVRVPPLVEGLNAGEDVDVELLRPLQDVLGTIVVTGSHDLTLGVLEDVLKSEHPNYKLATSSVGSLSGLLTLGRGEAHLAATHLLDPDTGVYNLPDIERLLEDVPVVTVNLVVREQGLIVPPGNPLGLEKISDLARERVRFVNRQSGAGTRVLLDYLLERDDIDPDAIVGYEREEFTHMSVAVAVRSGLVDVGLGVQSAAVALGLDFVPVEREDYDLVLRADFAESAAGKALLSVIGGAAFRAAVEKLSGYDTSRTGQQK